MSTENYPRSLPQLPFQERRTAVKSSFIEPLSVLGVIIAAYLASDEPSEIPILTGENGDLDIEVGLNQRLNSFFKERLEHHGISSQEFEEQLRTSYLTKVQYEPLNVLFEIIWRLASFEFEDQSLNTSAERSGQMRYPKRIRFSSNMDIVKLVTDGFPEQTKDMLLSWVGFENVIPDQVLEQRVKKLFTVFAEPAVFQLHPEGEELKFRSDGVFRALVEGGPVSLDSKEELKGPARILKHLIRKNLLDGLSFSGDKVRIKEGTSELSLQSYTDRMLLKQRLGNYRPDSPAFEVVETDQLRPSDLHETEGNDQRPRNVIFYGVPGSGKSAQINGLLGDSAVYDRLVFHPDYSYSDFVGQILPVSKDGRVSYEFVPGPFTKILKNAIDNPSVDHYLIIEEINRGNPAAIFGDLFQLLDRRDDGQSVYGVTNLDVASAVFGNSSEKVLLPANLFLLATMNTSDQNVFTLDTAFQRRWTMRMIKNDLSAVPFAEKRILDTSVSWARFNAVVNEALVNQGLNALSVEDKRLGAFFVRESDLVWTDPETLEGDDARNALESNSAFGETVLKYLWDDAFKFSREQAFNMDFQTLESVITRFGESRGDARFEVFSDSIVSRLIDVADRLDANPSDE